MQEHKLNRLFAQSITLFGCILFMSSSAIAQNQSTEPWPELTRTHKPWTRWWWMGNAVDEPNIKAQLEEMSKAGLGGVEIQPIYGVKGEEKNYLKYLSSEWLNALDYTIKTAGENNMGVDMTLGTGWPYGGPQVTQEDAATKLIIDTLHLSKGEKIDMELLPKNEKDRGASRPIEILAFDNSGHYENLTSLAKDGHLKWKTKRKDYKLYLFYEAKTGQQVKRAAPGGAGLTVDHYSKLAFQNYVKPFNEAFSTHGKNLRTIFNDSYEVYGTDFTPRFFKEFQERRGYDLRPYIQQLLSGNNETANRLRSDYRETLSDLLLTQFDRPWTEWANEKGFLTRLQAHGSPGNLIDMYASADIPECETFGSMPYEIEGLRREEEDIRQGDADAVMLKFSSSAAHISGKQLTSSETFTWLRDHFKTALSQTKPEAEDLLLNGINHIFLHGATYSPDRAEWPGWKFYASVNFNPNNTIWQDASELFSYIANCQSLLQSGQPDNDVLLYWPIHDVWHEFHNGSLFFQFKIHSLDEWLLKTPFYQTNQEFIKKGISTDFISDRFIEEAKVINGEIVLPGGTYKSLVVPPIEHMPFATLEKLISLKEEGASIIFQDLPSTVPGFFEFEKRCEMLKALMSENKLKPTTDLWEDLKMAGVKHENLVKSGLKFIKRKVEGEQLYFLVNHTAQNIDDYIPITAEAKEVIILDPLTKTFGKAATQKQGEQTLVKVQIPSGGSLFLKSGKESNMPTWNYSKPIETEYPLEGEWTLSFISGGPQLPKTTKINQLKSWTVLSKEAEYFSGTAKYEIDFENPDEQINHWRLHLGDVRESAKVWLNEEYLGALWSNPFQIDIDTLKKGRNSIKIEVTNLPANRIRAKELRGEEWKIFHEINMVNKDYKEFDATKWQPMPSGLLNTPTLQPLQLDNN
ncbi:glycoside hydrolase [Euzebyella marina]|uniref:Glycoside hydrolase n=1 Tax=Euzebyella marina TaxID=1761453 RepID=A0A3G2L1Z9_9FLAO|nr:glycosyl hydrolase [Euzebyella marina]AYN66297.1 glycoside hydrolase [Euzebyella marina]